MRYLHSKVSTFGIFLCAAILFIVYLFSIRFNASFPGILFWISAALMIGTIFFQCFRLELSSSFVTIILLEIAIICIAFHLAEQIPFFGLTDSDPYVDLVSAKGLLSSGFIRGNPWFVNATSYYPMIHVLGAQLSLITDIDLLDVAKWFPSFIDIAFILLLYLFIHRIFQDKKVALISVLSVTIIQVHILFGSLFTRETIALVLFVGCLYFYFSARSSSNPITYILLSIIFLIGTTISHHFTSFMLVVFILIHYIVMNIAGSSFIRKTYLNTGTIGVRMSGYFALFALVSLLSYWFIVVQIRPPQLTLASFFESLFRLDIWGQITYGDVAGLTSRPESLRGNILYWGMYITLFTFVIILLYGILPRLRNNRIEALTFTLFLFLCGSVALIHIYIVPFGIGIFADRFLVFGWLFGFAPLIFLILYRLNKLPRRVGIFILVFFIVLNIYSMDSSLWDARQTEIPSATTEEEYSLANRIDFNNDRIAVFSYARFAIYDVHNNHNFSFFDETLDLVDYNWIVSHKETLRRALIYPPTYEVANELSRPLNGTSTDWMKIYESDNYSVSKYAYEESRSFTDQIERARIYNGNSPIIIAGSTLEWKENIREIGNVLYEPTSTEWTYKTFYSRYQGNYHENNVYLGFAYSADGNMWTDYGKIIPRALEDPYVIKVNGTYYLYAEDKADIPFRNIRRYHSLDCINWIDDGIVLEPETSGWDSQDVSSPVVWREGNEWYMLYEGRNKGADGQIGLATSLDGLNWNKLSSNPIFSGSGTGEDFDKDQVVPDDLILIDSTYYLIYHGYSNHYGWSTGIASSRDTLSWMRGNKPISLSSTVMVYFDGTNYVAHYLIDSSSGIYKGYLR